MKIEVRSQPWNELCTTLKFTLNGKNVSSLVLDNQDVKEFLYLVARGVNEGLDDELWVDGVRRAPS